MNEKFGPGTPEFERCVNYPGFKNLIGKDFNDLHVEELMHVQRHNITSGGWDKYWRCSCMCGNKNYVCEGGRITKETMTDCGCSYRNTRPTKVCSRCDVEYPNTLEFFHKHSGYKASGLESRCKKCKLEIGNPRSKKCLRSMRIKVLEIVGKGKIECYCCGEKTKEFLTLDHINGDGKEHRKNGSWVVTKSIISGEYKGQLRISCYNCNSGREFTEGKICPH